MLTQQEKSIHKVNDNLNKMEKKIINLNKNYY